MLFTVVVGTQKNRPNETVLLSTQNIYIKNYLPMYAENICLSKPVREVVLSFQNIQNHG